VHIDAVRAEATRHLTAGNALLASIGRTANLVEQRHASQWLADVEPTSQAPTLEKALRTARALAQTARLDVTPLLASG
jgi:hypothetical protein